MIDIKRIKNALNPVNVVVSGLITLFIVIRVLSNNHENAFIIDSINPTETLVISENMATSDNPETYEAEKSSKITEDAIQPQIDSQVQSESLAYSVELGKTFSLDAFNQLSKDDLMTFSGIGEVTAQAILDYRKDNGPFGDFKDLMLVKGIGEKKLQKIMTILP